MVINHEATKKKNVICDKGIAVKLFQSWRFNYIKSSYSETNYLRFSLAERTKTLIPIGIQGSLALTNYYVICSLIIIIFHIYGFRNAHNDIMDKTNIKMTLKCNHTLIKLNNQLHIDTHNANVSMCPYLRHSANLKIKYM